jgi:hypothetical protein
MSGWATSAALLLWLSGLKLHRAGLVGGKGWGAPTGNPRFSSTNVTEHSELAGYGHRGDLMAAPGADAHEKGMQRTGRLGSCRSLREPCAIAFTCSGLAIITRATNGTRTRDTAMLLAVASITTSSLASRLLSNPSSAVRVMRRVMSDLVIEVTDEMTRYPSGTGSRDPLLANLYMRRFVLGWKMLGLEISKSF